GGEGRELAGAEPAKAYSTAGGRAGTQAGGRTSACGARPGQAQSPRLSSHSCGREVYALPDIREIEREGWRKSQVLHERAHCEARLRRGSADLSTADHRALASRADR